MSSSRVALAAVLLGVSGLFAPAPGMAQEGPQEEGARLTVQNDAPGIVRVYVLQAGHMAPVGTVEASRDTTLTIPAPFVEAAEEVQLVAEPVGGESWFMSEPVEVRASSRVALNVSANIAGSSVSVDG